MSPEIPQRRRGLTRVRALAVLSLVLTTGLTSATLVEPTAASTITQTFTAAADARVEEAAPGRNYGTSFLRTNGGGQLGVESYLRFSVTGISGTIRSVKLRVFAYTDTVDGPALYATDTAWTETGITWSNRAARTSGALGDAGAVPVNSWVEYDVSSLVRSAGTYSFALASTSTDGVNFYSRETTSSQPVLVVEAELPAGTSSPPVNSSPPTVTGAARDGQTLTADPGSWTGTPPLVLGYQWRRCDTAGASCADIGGATGQSYQLAGADIGRTLRIAVTGSNAAGASTASSNATAVVAAAGPPPPTPADPIVAAAGDIACDPASAAFGGGLGTATECRQHHTAELAAALQPDTILLLGDIQYNCGGASAFAQSYDPSWGRLKAITRPAPGNHEYQTSGGTDCDAGGTAKGYYSYFGAAAGDPAKGYYSFEIGDWHIIALNSNCAQIGGCHPGSPQEQWLRLNLATSAVDCTLAYWHHPLFSSGRYAPGVSEMRPLFQALYDYDADVVLSGHDHNYERFAPQNPNGVLDLRRGIREFIVGTGGKSLYAQGSPLPNSEIRHSGAFGILELTLQASSYGWRFVSETPSVSDSGTGSCHSPTPDSEPPTGPGDLAASAPTSNRVDLSWTASSDNAGVTGYEIHRNGALVATTGVVTAYSDGTVAPSTLYEYRVKARDAAGNVSQPSNAATVTTPSRGTVLTFTPAADARVEEAAPGRNYGTSFLRTNGGGQLGVESYLRFSVTGISGTIRSVKLRVFAYTDTVDGPALYATDTAWTETGITWSNRAARTSGALGDAGAVPVNSWVEYDVSSLVRSAGTYSFALASTSTDGVNFYSRETTSYQPVLVVTVG